MDTLNKLRDRLAKRSTDPGLSLEEILTEAQELGRQTEGMYIKNYVMDLIKIAYEAGVHDGASNPYC